MLGRLALRLESGDDFGEWARDSECDEPSFEGTTGMGATESQEHSLSDARDCCDAFAAGSVWLRDKWCPVEADESVTSHVGGRRHLVSIAAWERTISLSTGPGIYNSANFNTRAPNPGTDDPTLKVGTFDDSKK